MNILQGISIDGKYLHDFWSTTNGSGMRRDHVQWLQASHQIDALTPTFGVSVRGSSQSIHCWKCLVDIVTGKYNLFLRQPHCDVIGGLARRVKQLQLLPLREFKTYLTTHRKYSEALYS